LNKVRNHKVRLGVLAACSMAFSLSISANSSYDVEFDDELEAVIENFNSAPFASNARLNIPHGLNAKFASDGIIVKYKPGKTAMSSAALSNRARTDMKFNRNMFNGIIPMLMLVLMLQLHGM